MPPITSRLVPVLFKKANCAALVCPTAVAGNRRFGRKLTVVGCIPVPVKATDCGAPVAVLWIVTVAKNGPAAVGTNVMLTKQAIPGAIMPPQVFVALKAPAFVPLSGDVNTRFVFPVFCRKTDWALLVPPIVCRPNEMELGKIVPSVAVGLSPSPERKTNCGTGSLSVTVKSPLNEFAVVGENIILIVQLAPGANPPVTGQPFAEIEKGAVTVGLMFVSVAAVDAFFSVAIIAVLLVFITVLGNCSDPGVRFAICGVPVPVTFTFAGLFANVPKI